MAGVAEIFLVVCPVNGLTPRAGYLAEPGLPVLLLGPNIWGKGVKGFLPQAQFVSEVLVSFFFGFVSLLLI